MDSRIIKSLKAKAAKETAEAIQAIVPRIEQIEQRQDEILALLRQLAPPTTAPATTKAPSKSQ